MIYGTRGARFLAFLVDVVVIFVIEFVIGLVLGLVGVIVAAQSMGWVIGMLVSILYFVGYQYQTGQTVGKKVLHLKVVDAEGNKPGVITFFLREVVGKFISWLILGIGFLMILWDSKRQGLHDKIASTYVVKA